MPGGNTQERTRKLRSEKASLSSPHPTSSPTIASSTTLLWNRIETRLDKLTKDISESIAKQIKDEMDLLHKKLSDRIHCLESEFNDKIKTVEQKFSERYSSINNALFINNGRITQCEAECNNIEELHEQLSLMQLQTQNLVTDNTQLKNQIDALARQNIAGDMVLHGIPYTENENLVDIFFKICSALNQKTSMPLHIFRTTPANKSTSSPIIVKLSHSLIKKQLLNAAAVFFKTNNRSVSLDDLGYDSNKFVRIYESLTKQNHLLFKIANEQRRNKCLHSVFTRDGRVFIKMIPESRPLFINNIASLESAISESKNESERSLPLPDDTAVAIASSTIVTITTTAAAADASAGVPVD